MILILTIAALAIANGAEDVTVTLMDAVVPLLLAAIAEALWMLLGHVKTISIYADPLDKEE